MTPAEFLVYYPQLEGTDENDVLEELIDAADAMIAEYCGFPKTVDGIWTLTEADYVVYLDGPSLTWSEALCLCVHPLVAVTELNADLTRAYDGSTLRTDWTIDRDAGLVMLTSGAPAWPVGRRSIRVAFTGGYAVTPPNLRTAIATTVRHLWDRRNTQGQTAYGMGGDSASLTDTDDLIPAAARARLWGFLTPCAKARLLREQAAR